MQKFFAALLSHAFLIAAFMALFAGVFWLETHQEPLWDGYVAVIAGAATIVLLPQRVSFGGIIGAEWRIAIVASAFCGVLCAHTVFTLVSAGGEPGPYPLLVVWGGAVALIVFSAFCADRALAVDHTVPRGVLPAACFIFAMALLARAWGPRTLAGDEFIHTHYMLRVADEPNPQVLGVMGDDGYPFVFIYLQSFVYRAFANILNPVAFEKWLSFVCGALSVVFWYVVVRLRSGALVASCSTVLLALFGWHWLNSRFIYAYPPDLAVISLGIMASCLSLRFKSFFWAAIGGIAAAVALILQKGGMLLAPVMAYLFVEAFFASARVERRRLGGLLVTGVVACLLCYEPFLIQQLQGKNLMPLQLEAVRVKAELFPKLGFTPLTAALHVFGDAFLQFQVSINDFHRHMFRPREPILDPVFSALFSVGFLACLAGVWRSPAARFCLVGLLVFILPMALSFPLNDPDRGVSRRMIGASFFLVWIGAVGADIIARRIVSKNLVRGAALALCSLSALTNVWMFFMAYQNESGTECYSPAGRGLQSRAMIDLALKGEANKIPTVVLEMNDGTVLDMPDSSVRRSSTLTRVSSVADLRAALAKNQGRLQLVIMPWDSLSVPRDSQAVVSSLADIIPPFLWIPGREDQDGVPMVRYAYVRIGA